MANPISSDWCADAWVATQVLVSLGFEQCDIFFGYADVAPLGKCVAIILETQKNPVAIPPEMGRFVWTIRKLAEAEEETVIAEWESFISVVNGFGTSAAQALWTSAPMVCAGGPHIASVKSAIRSCGIMIPADHAETLGRLNDKVTLVCWLKREEYAAFAQLLRERAPTDRTDRKAVGLAVFSALGIVLGDNNIEKKVRGKVLGVRVVDPSKPFPASRWEEVTK